MSSCAICQAIIESPAVNSAVKFYHFDGRHEMAACLKCSDAAEATVGRGGSGYSYKLHPNVYDVLREMLKLTQGAKR